MDWDDTLAGKGLEQQELLQTTLYMWQDLGVLSETLSQKLEPDLILFFRRKSELLKSNDAQAMSSSSLNDAMMSSDGNSGDDYDAVGVISYCYSKWMHVAYNWSRFLPKKTCVKLLEDHLFWPHLQHDWLLNPKHFDPILEKAFADESLMTNTTMPSVAVGLSTSTANNSTSYISTISPLSAGGLQDSTTKVCV